MAMGMVALSDDNRMLCCIYFRALFTSSVSCRLWESLSFKHILHLPVLLPSLDPPNLTVASKVLEKLTSAREWGPPFESYLWSCSPCHGTCSSRNDSLHLLRQRGVSMNQLAWPCCFPPMDFRSSAPPGETQGTSTGEPLPPLARGLLHRWR